MTSSYDTRPKVGFHLVGKPDGPKHIVLTERPWRSKYYTLVCFCKRRRRNGTCQRLDAFLPILRHPERGWMQHPEIDKQRFRVPV